MPTSELHFWEPEFWNEIIRLYNAGDYRGALLSARAGLNAEGSFKWPPGTLPKNKPHPKRPPESTNALCLLGPMLRGYMASEIRKTLEKYTNEELREFEKYDGPAYDAYDPHAIELSTIVDGTSFDFEHILDKPIEEVRRLASADGVTLIEQDFSIFNRPPQAVAPSLKVGVRAGKVVAVEYPKKQAKGVTDASE